MLDYCATIGSKAGSPLMDIILQHFWLLCGVWVAVVGGFFYRNDLKRIARAGEISHEQINRYARRCAIAVLVPSASLWVLQITVGPAAKPFFPEWPNPQWMIAHGITVSCWIALLWWVWARNGAEHLSQVAKIRSYPSYMTSPVAFRVLSLAVVASGIVSLLFGW